MYVMNHRHGSWIYTIHSQFSIGSDQFVYCERARSYDIQAVAVAIDHHHDLNPIAFEKLNLSFGGKISPLFSIDVHSSARRRPRLEMNS